MGMTFDHEENDMYLSTQAASVQLHDRPMLLCLEQSGRFEFGICFP